MGLRPSTLRMTADSRDFGLKLRQEPDVVLKGGAMLMCFLFSTAALRPAISISLKHMRE
jgi:hypothetical protein